MNITGKFAAAVASTASSEPQGSEEYCAQVLGPFQETRCHIGEAPAHAPQSHSTFFSLPAGVPLGWQQQSKSLPAVRDEACRIRQHKHRSTKTSTRGEEMHPDHLILRQIAFRKAQIQGTRDACLCSASMSGTHRHVCRSYWN
jgi:hypothetical protein